MILRAPTLGKAAIIDRQRLFDTLSKNETYRKILHYSVKCADLESAWKKVWNASKTGINKALNPVR